MTQKMRVFCLIFLLAGLALGVGGAAGGPTTPAVNAGWEELGVGSASGGGISDNAGDSRLVTLAILADGRPVVAWSDDSSGNREIYLRLWNGPVWVEMGGSASGGGISDNEGASEEPSLAVGPAGELYIAWHDESNGFREVYVRRWNGSTWQEVGVGSATGGGISQGYATAGHPEIAVTPNGTPVVVWEDNRSGDWEIYVRRWDGSNWVEMGSGSATDGGISNNSSGSGIPALALDLDGNPIVAWHDDGGGNLDIYARRWNGSAWTEMGGSATGGGISATDDLSGSPSVAVMADGSPVVAWDEGFYGANIYLRRWNGAAWVEMGAESASGGGISQWGLGNIPRLAIAPDGLPTVAWHSYGTGNYEILARRWTGQVWDEFGLGAASNGGISDTLAESFGARLAFRPSGEAIVAWEDGESGDYEIYVRAFPACHVLALNHSGNGSDPGPALTHSIGCGLDHYLAGEPIMLTANPAAGWRVAGWSGTDDDASTATTNTVTMPDGEHAVGVTYEEIPIYQAFIAVAANDPTICFAGPNEQESNNTQPQANGPLCNGRAYSGLPTDHFDIFYFDLGQTADVVATLDNHSGSGVQLALHHQAITANPLDVDFSAAGGFRVGAPNAAPGRYYVVIYAETTGSTAPYTLRAEWH